AVVTDCPALRDVRYRLIAGPIPGQQRIWTGAGAPRVPHIAGTREALTPGSAVLADLMHGFDDKGLTTDALLHRRQRTGCDTRRQHRCFLELLWPQCGIDDDFGTFQFADQLSRNRRITGLCDRVANRQSYTAKQCQHTAPAESRPFHVPSSFVGLDCA